MREDYQKREKGYQEKNNRTYMTSAIPEKLRFSQPGCPKPNIIPPRLSDEARDKIKAARDARANTIANAHNVRMC